MRSGQVWLTLLLATAIPFSAFAHGKNDLNRNHPGRTEARTGNFRRAEVLKVTKAHEYAWVRPLARAIAFSAKDQRPILDRIAKYRQRGEELALVALHNGTGAVKVVAIPTDKKVAPRVMGNKEIKRLGISPQDAVVPSLLARVRGAEVGPVPAKDVRPASLSSSGLSYQGTGRTPAKWPSHYRPLEPGERAVTETYMTLPITAKKGNLRGAYITGWVTTEKKSK